MIYQILIVALIIEALVAFWKPKYAIGICLAIIFLFPNSLKFNVGINLNSFNLAVIIVVLSLVKTILTTKSLYPQIPRTIKFYTIYVATTSFFCALTNISFGEYIQNMILFVMEYGLIAYALSWICMGEKDFKVFNIVLITVSCIIICYGLLNYATKINPYMAYISMVTDSEIDMSNSFMEEQRGLLDGRISSVFPHPLQLGQWSLLVFAYFYYELKEKVNSFFYYTFLFLIFIIAFMTGSRSALVPILLVPIINLLHQSPFKIIRYSILAVFSLIVLFPFLPNKVQDNVEATVFFGDDEAASKAEIRGSSKDGRIGQFEIALSEIRDNPLLGKGFNYSSKNREKLSAGLLGLESIFLSHIIDGGILGLIIFIFFYITLYRKIRNSCDSNMTKAMADSLCIPFFISISLTGISYSFFCVYLIFYMIMQYKIQTIQYPSNCKLVKNLK